MDLASNVDLYKYNYFYFLVFYEIPKINPRQLGKFVTQDLELLKNVDFLSRICVYDVDKFCTIYFEVFQLQGQFE